MPVYVDDLMEHGAPGMYRGKDAAQAERVGARNGHRWCHLFSDETDPAFPELHAFAKRIGMRRSWFQGDHYDLTPGRRAAAVRAGAREATRKEAVAIWKRTPRARRRKCRACDYVTEPQVEPPKSCPNCSLVAGAVNIGPWPPEDGRDWYSQCARCGSSAYRQDCEACGGEGLSHHDCGEDTCNCLDPEPNVRCSVCGGVGGWMVCLSDAKWCEANPAPGREKVPRGKIEWFVLDRGAA